MLVAGPPDATQCLSFQLLQIGQDRASRFAQRRGQLLLVDEDSPGRALASDVIFEFLLCEEYVRIVAGSEDREKEKEVIQTEMGKLLSAMWGRSNEIVTSERVRRLRG